MINRVTTVLILLLITPMVALAKEVVVILDVDKMDCASCPIMVKQALEDLLGVTSATVTMNPGIATIVIDDARVSRETLIQTTTKLGFPSNERKD